MKVIFLLYNIFDIKSGVSSKYIKFIEYLKNNHIQYVVLTTSNDKTYLEDKHIFILKGFNLPYYNNIKIPNIKYETIEEIIKEDDIIIFNGEFYWIYDILNKIKKNYQNIKIIPNWHTNYEYYSNIYFQNNLISKKIKNILYNNLQNQFFSGIIVTGEITKKNFLNYSKYVFNANEICLDHFSNFKIDNYDKKKLINFIYTGRIALEKNLSFIIDILNYLESSKFKNYKMHFIGDGPYLEELKEYINESIRKKIIFYGDTCYSKIINIYSELDNRIFIQSSKSETFGKATMEASYSGIPVFIIKCDIHEALYTDKNSFIFDDEKDFAHLLTFFFKLNNDQRKKIIENGFQNAKKYDQNIIFKNLKDFILNISNNSHTFYNEFFIKNIFHGVKCGIDYFEN